ncbi:hypothetical protein EY04_27485 [Pseudomonas chlororaphis]|nr:hypothetical protein EY04_27485 [Pseudomonas chlororaphis]
MTLDGLAARLVKQLPEEKPVGLRICVIRYADDFIITGNSKEWLEQDVKLVVVEFMAERGLVLSPEKIKVMYVKDGFDFLEWNIRKYNGKRLMKPWKANVKGHLDKVRKVVKVNKTAKQVNLIRLLNPILRGWANYPRHVVSKKPLLESITIFGQCYGNGRQEGIRIKEPNGQRRNTSVLKVPETGFCHYRRKRGLIENRLHPAERIRHANTAAHQD